MFHLEVHGAYNSVSFLFNGKSRFLILKGANEECDCTFAGGDVSTRNVWLTEAVLDIFTENK